MIGGAADHDAIDIRKLCLDRVERVDAAVDGDGKVGKGPLQLMGQRIVERRDIAVLLGRQPLEPGFSRMDQQRVHARLDRGPRHGEQRFAWLLIVDADAAFDRHRQAGRLFHRGDASPDQFGLAHQAGPEGAVLHPVGRAADIEIDFEIAVIGADGGGARKI